MKKTKWYAASAAAITVIAALSAFGSTRFPLFLDIYYHLNVMRGFDSAGGIVARAFWELAPVGQPLLYPPLFHLLLLIPFKAGAGIIGIAKAASLLPAAILFAAAAYVTGRLISARQAFFAVLALLIPYSFYLKLTITVPVTICLIFAVMAFYSVERRRPFAAAVFVSFSFYTHIALPYMIAASFVLYGILNKEARKTAFRCVVAAAAMSSPVIFRTLASFGKFTGIFGISMPEGSMFEIYPLVYIMAAVGLSGLRRPATRPLVLFCLSLLASFLPMAVNYRFRFISGEGMLPVLLLAGIGLDAAYGAFTARAGSSRTGPAAASLRTAAFIAFFAFFSPSASSYIPLSPPYNEKVFSVHMADSTVCNLIPSLKKHLRPFEISIYDDEAAKWAKAVEQMTAPDDIICSNDAFMASMLSAISGRANAARSFLEVKEPDVPISEFGSSRLVVWVREPNGKFSSDLNTCISKFGYSVAWIDEYSALLVRPAGSKVKKEKPAVPLAVAYSLLAVFAAAALIDLSRK